MIYTEKKVKDLEKGDTIILNHNFVSWTVKVVGLIKEKSQVKDVVVKDCDKNLQLMSMYLGQTKYGKRRDIKDKYIREIREIR